MLIREFAGDSSDDLSTQKLVALSQFLLGRSEDTTAKKQISQDAFIDIAKSLGVSVSKENLGELIAKPPLNNVLEPLQPNSGVVRFRGNEEAAPGMTVDQAEQVVDKNAKAAMKRGMKGLSEGALPKEQLDQYRDAVLATTDLNKKKVMIKKLIDLALINDRTLYNSYSMALNQTQDPNFLNNMTDRVVGYYLSKQQ